MNRLNDALQIPSDVIRFYFTPIYIINVVIVISCLESIFKSAVTSTSHDVMLNVMLQ